ncbi:Hypothetical predicted protein [Cloeon dipterum]|uniref:Uncharacterized protein n=1 Tax=Cloeon dipterum TaxID=197152 RepID=A0A8S1BS92_9INSE|nr:Hypothetical predicted protein [Cloeon dipterum]
MQSLFEGCHVNVNIQDIARWKSGQDHQNELNECKRRAEPPLSSQPKSCTALHCSLELGIGIKTKTENSDPPPPEFMPEEC